MLHRKPETFRNYRQYLHGHLVPRFGAKRLARLARADVRTLQRDLEGERLNGTAAAHLHAQPDQIAVAGVMRDLYPEEEVPVHCEDLGRITLKGFVSAVRLYSVS